MYLTRQQGTTKLPIPRKGTKYLARASDHCSDAVSVVLAVRDMLGLAKTAKEVKKMIQDKLLKINGRSVKDMHESVKLFNLLEAGKVYRLSLLPTKKFFFEEISSKDAAKELRLVKVTNKRLVSEGRIQLNFHDGSNILTSEKIAVSDSVYLDLDGKIKKHIKPEKGKEAMVIAGKHTGKQGTIESLEKGVCRLKLKGESITVHLHQLIVL